MLCYFLTQEAIEECADNLALYVGSTGKLLMEEYLGWTTPRAGSKRNPNNEPLLMRIGSTGVLELVPEPALRDHRGFYSFEVYSSDHKVT